MRPVVLVYDYRRRLPRLEACSPRNLFTRGQPGDNPCVMFPDPVLDGKVSDYVLLVIVQMVGVPIITIRSGVL